LWWLCKIPFETSHKEGVTKKKWWKPWNSDSSWRNNCSSSFTKSLWILEALEEATTK
jgi:hypothetical protein